MAAKRDPNEMGTDDETQGFHKGNVEMLPKHVENVGKD